MMPQNRMKILEKGWHWIRSHKRRELDLGWRNGLGTASRGRKGISHQGVGKGADFEAKRTEITVRERKRAQEWTSQCVLRARGSRCDRCGGVWHLGGEERGQSTHVPAVWPSGVVRRPGWSSLLTWDGEGAGPSHSSPGTVTDSPPGRWGCRAVSLITWTVAVQGPLTKDRSRVRRSGLTADVPCCSLGLRSPRGPGAPSTFFQAPTWRTRVVADHTDPRHLHRHFDWFSP